MSGRNNNVYKNSNPISTMNNKNSILTCCLTILLTATNGLSEEKRQAADLPTVAVHVQTVQESSSHAQVELVATIQAVQQAAIAAKVTGTITELPVVLGSRVKRGDLLVKISAEEISARLLQAQAQLDQAKRNLAREQKLLKKNATTPETVKSMQDMFAVARASVQEAKAMLGYTAITAPYDGVITSRFNDEGVYLSNVFSGGSQSAVLQIQEFFLRAHAPGAPFLPNEPIFG